MKTRMFVIGRSSVSECKVIPIRSRFAKLSFDVWVMRMRMFEKKRQLAWENAEIHASSLSSLRCSISLQSRFEWLKLRRLS